MIKLSDRLQIIADRIQPAKTMADIGTDHGFLPIYLVETGQCSRVIMADISYPSLDKARKNAEACSDSIQEHIELRAGDGLHVLSPGEVNAVVIAGMGGKLIRDIMASDMNMTRSVHKYVLQPRIGQGYLRKWLYDNDFTIVAEDLVVEGDYIPEIITVVSPDAAGDCIDAAGGYREQMLGAAVDDIIWRIPPWIVKAAGPVEEFLNRNITKEKMKLENVMRAKVRETELEAKIISEINYLTKLVEEYRNG